MLTRTVAPGSHSPEMSRIPSNSSSHGRIMAVRLMSASGRI
jgi:hypothetical protein